MVWRLCENIAYIFRVGCSNSNSYQDFLGEVSTLLTAARKQAARAINSVLVATYWELGRRIVEFEQAGKERAGYGEQLLQRLSSDLGKRFGRGFSVDNLESMRLFYLAYMEPAISETASRELAAPEKSGTQSRIFPLDDLMAAFPLSWSHYILKDEYSENALEEALIHHLETFLLELGGDFCFVGRQKRLRIGTEWYRVDLVFYHRRLRCLMLIDLKLGRFTHADAGQMHLYLNYAREHWTHEDENPPVGLILCSYKESAVVKYALEGLANKVMAAEYRTALPDEGRLAKEIENTRRLLDEKLEDS